MREIRQDDETMLTIKQSPSFILSTQQQTLSPTYSIGVRSLPIRCTVVRGEADLSASPQSSTTILVQDSFAILPGNMLLKDIVKTALLKLGFPPTDSIGAKGYIEIKNWKPLLLTSITKESGCTIEHILGDVISVSTFIICLHKKSKLSIGSSSQNQTLTSPSSPSYATLYSVPKLKGIPVDDVEWTDEAVRAAVFQLLKEVSQTALSKISPLPQSMISNIANFKYTATISTGTCHDFGLWYRQYRKEHEEPHNSSEGKLNSRQTFHSEYELPLMKSWLHDCPNPSEDAFKQYLNELNASPIRQERGPITLQRLKLWWRNEKIRSERRESVIKLRSASTDSTHLPEGPNWTPVRRGRKPRRRKTKHPIQMVPDQSDNVMTWDGGRVSYGSGDSTGNNEGISYANGSSDVRKDLFNSSTRGEGSADIYEHGGRGSDIDGTISGRNETNVTNVEGRSPPGNDDSLVNCRNIQSVHSRNEMDYSPGHCSDRDIASVTHAAICSSIHTFHNLTDGGTVATVGSDNNGGGRIMYSHQPNGVSPSENSTHHHAMPLSLIRSNWN